MKKLIVLFMGLWGASQGHAQYFQHFYANNILKGGNGQPCTAGHLMATLTQYSEISVVKTDADGRFTSANDFNNTYTLSDAAAISANNPNGIVSAASVKITGVFSGDYAVVGSYTYEDPMSSQNVHCLFFMMLNTSGTPTILKGYNMPGYATVSSVQPDPYVTDRIYATGNVYDASSENSLIYVIKIDLNNGSLSWGKTYDVPASNNKWASDLLRMDMSQGTSLLVVGGYIDNTGCGNKHGLYLSLDPSNGNIQSSKRYSLNNGELHINGIHYSTHNGYVLVGYTRSCSGGGDQAWLMHIAYNGTAGMYSKKYTSPTSGNMSFLADITYRPLGVNTYEYFATGMDLNPGVSTDAIVLRLDNTGSLTSGMIYDPGGNEWGESIGLISWMTPPGLGIYALSDDHMYIIKSYYNGVSGCNENSYTPDVSDVNVDINDEDVDEVSTIDTRDISYFQIVPNPENELCHAETLPEGSVPAMSSPQAETAKNSIGIYPNPAGNSFTIKCDQPEATRIEIYNLTGQLVFKQEISPANEITVTSKNWNNGLYLVKIYSNSTLLGTSKLIIKQ